ncbi:MAG TPA: hypothetical protein VG106_08590 [Vicinamibacterales bacterium]|nr:hypothetical protein [Vicinamibacterales bacterium]
MHNEDLDKSMTNEDRMRNREDMDRVPHESQDDLQEKQIEGNLGNERVRDKSRSSRDDMRGIGE